MGRKIQFKRGLEADLPQLDEAEFGFATDTKTTYMGTIDGNISLLNSGELDDFEYSELSSYSTNLDANNIYVNVEWKRPDMTIYAKSTLIGTTPNYNQAKMEYYNKPGTAIVKTITWNIGYDTNDFPYQKVVV